MFASVSTKGGSGLAFDEQGHLYVAAGGLLHQLGNDGKPISTVPAPSGGIDFGAGVLRCADLYIASEAGLQILPLERAGMNVPWHRAP